MLKSVKIERPDFVHRIALEEMIAVLQNMIVVSMCRRRAPRDDVARTETEASCTQMFDKAMDCAQSSSDEDNKSTDTSGPELIVDTSSDESDTDEMDLEPNSEPSSGESDSECQPQRPRKFQEFKFQHGRFGRKRQAARRRSRAAFCQPSAVATPPVAGAPQDGTPIRSVINALNDWLETNATEDEQQDDAPEGDDLRNLRLADVLHDALSNIAPQDAAMMKLMLDSRLQANQL